jgi:hypothetical protein
MLARYDGWCRACSQRIQAGDDDITQRTDGVWVHSACPPTYAERLIKAQQDREWAAARARREEAERPRRELEVTLSAAAKAELALYARLRELLASAEWRWNREADERREAHRIKVETPSEIHECACRECGREFLHVKALDYCLAHDPAKAAA